MDSREPEVSDVSSLVPTSRRTPISTREGALADSVRMVIPFLSLLTS